MHQNMVGGAGCKIIQYDIDWCKLQTYQNDESSARIQGCRCDWIRQLLQGKIWRHVNIFNRALAWMLLCAWARSPHQTCVRRSAPNGAHRPSISATKCHVVFLCSPSKYFYHWMPSCMFVLFKTHFFCHRMCICIYLCAVRASTLQPYLWFFYPILLSEKKCL